MKWLTKHLKDTLNTSPLKDISLLHIKVTREEMIWKNLMKYCAAKNSMEKGYRNTDEEKDPRGVPPVWNTLLKYLEKFCFGNTSWPGGTAVRDVAQVLESVQHVGFLSMALPGEDVSGCSSWRPWQPEWAVWDWTEALPTSGKDASGRGQENRVKLMINEHAIMFYSYRQFRRTIF